MLWPLIGIRLHGLLDDLVVLTYLLGAVALHLQGVARTVALAGAAAHFVLTRFTNYPEGTVKVIPFRVHAFIELAEGLAVVAATVELRGSAPASARLFLLLLGLSQFVAFSLSDYRTPAGPAARA
jgi:hypothetical protein